MKNLESTAPQEGARGGDDHLHKSEAPMASKSREREDWGAQVLGREWEGESSGKEWPERSEDEWVVEREKSGLNDVGPKPTKQVQPVRPVAPTGPTELSQKIWSVSFIV